MVSIVERRNWEERERNAVTGRGTARLGAAAQSRQSWARRVETLEDVPSDYRDEVLALVGGGRLPPAVLCPAAPTQRRLAAEHLLLDLGDAIAVVELTAGGAHPTVHPIAEISDVVSGEILLDSWLTLRSLGRDGWPRRSLIQFNTASGEMLAPFLAACRPTGGGGDAPIARARWLLEVQEQSLKFAGLARAALRPTDRVRGIVFQPLVIAPRRYLRGGGARRNRAVLLAALVMLTDTELIVIREDRTAPASSDGGRLGWERRCRRLAPPIAARVEAQRGGVTLVRLGPADDAIDVLVDGARAPELVRLCAQVDVSGPGGEVV